MHCRYEALLGLAQSLKDIWARIDALNPVPGPEDTPPFPPIYLTEEDAQACESLMDEARFILRVAADAASEGDIEDLPKDLIDTLELRGSFKLRDYELSHCLALANALRALAQNM